MRPKRYCFFRNNQKVAMWCRYLPIVNLHQPSGVPASQYSRHTAKICPQFPHLKCLFLRRYFGQMNVCWAPKTIHLFILAKNSECADGLTSEVWWHYIVYCALPCIRKRARFDINNLLDRSSRSFTKRQYRHDILPLTIPQAGMEGKVNLTTSLSSPLAS